MPRISGTRLISLAASPVPLQSLKYTQPTKTDDPRGESRDTNWRLVPPWYLVSPCSICGRVCGSRIGLDAHVKWHQRQGGELCLADLTQFTGVWLMASVCVCVCVCV
ncbi:unnamed protein product [Leuciscus chuanchicus]